MHLLRFDSVGGASGAMVFASLLDFGIDAQSIQKQLSNLDIGELEVIKSDIDNGVFCGSSVEIKTPKTDGHNHRSPEDIYTIIDRSQLSTQVKDVSKKVYARLAKAEAAVHGTPIDKVHFHEVGEARAICNIVGSCIALEMLEIDKVSVGPLTLGQGTVKCQHGVIPVPAPATVELLKGHPVIQTDEMAELVTPTGAAMLMEWKTDEAFGQVTIIKGPANGFGNKDLKDRPNLLRSTLLKR